MGDWHIHRYQPLKNVPAFYAGSLEALNFGEAVAYLLRPNDTYAVHGAIDVRLHLGEPADVHSFLNRDTRPVLRLEPIDAMDENAKTLMDILHVRLHNGLPAHAIVMLEVNNILPQVWVQQLSQLMGVSRTPLREALRMLQREGLVEAEPNHRVRVADFSIPDLEQLYAMRISLETLAIRLTVPLLQADELRRLEGFLIQMAGLPTPEEYERWEVPHRAFHLSLVSHAGTRIVTMIAQLSDHAERYRRFYSTEAPRASERGMREHEAIVDACLARDPGLAAERLARHYSSVALGTLAVLAPEYDPVLVRTALHSVIQARNGGKNGAQNSK